MKRLLLISSAVGLCLAAPAFAQAPTEQEQLNRQKAAPPSTSAPAAQSQDRQRSNQQPTDQSGQTQQRPATGSPSPSAQAPSSQDQRGQAQNQQQPASSAQAPAPSGQAQSPAADQQRGQAPNQRDPAADRNKAQAPADQQQQRSATDRNQPPADRQQRSVTDRNQPAQGQADRRQSQQDMQRQDRRQDARTSSRDRASTSRNVDINETQRTRIASAISSVNVRPVNVNFRIATGVVVPRTVVLHTLPTSIVEIVPQFRGYNYFVTQEQIVIVEPRRKTVVAVLPAGGTARAQAPASSRASFTDQHREAIRSRASSLRSTATTGSSASRIVVEEEVPAAIELEEFPAEIVTEVPVVRTYRYFRQDNDVFVVDPVQRRVIEIIR